MFGTGCECSLREKLVGDGCSKCNPRLYLEILTDQLNEQKEETVSMSMCVNVEQYMKEQLDRLQRISDTQAAIIECQSRLLSRA